MNWRCAFARILFMASLTGLIVAGGCAKPRRIPPVDLGGVHGWKPVESSEPFGTRGTPLAISRNGSGVVRAAHSEVGSVHPPRPKTILALSGGGMYGSYTAGVLNGWSESGQRPVFDVVTGISTGGLIAPLAFLGSEYDDQMKLIYTCVSRRDIFTYRNWATIPFRDAAATTTPLRNIVEAGMTDDLILRLAAEHRKGRRLYIGTTNMDTRRFVTWDIGAIATRAESRDRADLKASKKLIVDVMIATCSLPGVFPPVPIDIELDGVRYTELHMDGGVTSAVWVPMPVLEAAAPDPRVPNASQPPTELYVILAGKPFPDSGQMEPKLLPVVATFLSTAQAAQCRRDLANLYHQAQLMNIRFHLTGVRSEFSTPAGGLEFDRKEMNRLYEEGVRVGKENVWWDTPPERGPGEHDPIRTGNRFQTSR
jgi:predicted acylesterase/phospholipase RssA